VDTAAECPTCLGVSRGGRIRVTERNSEMMLHQMRELRQNWLQLRRLYIDTGAVEAARASEENLKEIVLAIDELERTRVEMGWIGDGEPQRSHA